MHYRQQEKAGGGIPAESDGRHKPTKHKDSLCFVIGLIKPVPLPGNPSTDFVGPRQIVKQVQHQKMLQKEISTPSIF